MIKNKGNSKFVNLCRQRFTMVEITMAVAIIGIGMAGVMALLPIGFNATRDAMGDNYSSNMADQFLHVVAQQAKNDWTGWIINDTKIKTTKPSISDITDAVPVLGSPIISDLNLYPTNKIGVFYVEAKSNNIKDFSANMTIWKSTPRIAVFDSGAWTHTGYTKDKVVALNVEVSWPVEKPYDKREKRYYYLEIFAPK